MAHAPCHVLYEPLDIPKPVTPDVWIVDGPEIRMDYGPITMPFPTRSTVVRLSDGRLWVHSPTQLTEPLALAIEALGPVAFLIAPNSIHWWWVNEWKARWPDALCFAAPRVRHNSRDRFTAWDRDLGDAPEPEWAAEIDQTLAPGDVIDEAVFFHRASRTLILTDLIENFEPDRVCGRWRWLMKVSGCADPNGSAPYDMRLSFWRHRRRLREVVRKMLAWDPERVILAHGRWYQTNGAAEVRRAFGWVG